MEFGLREVLIGVGLLVIAGILFDGFRRMRRSKVGSLDLPSEMGGSLDDDWVYYKGELPNGGARIVQGNRQEPDFGEADFAAESKQEPTFNESFEQEMSDHDDYVDDGLYARRDDVVKNDAETRVEQPEPDAHNNDNVQNYVDQSLQSEPETASIKEETQSDLFADDEMLARAKQEQERKLASHYTGEKRAASGRAKQRTEQREARREQQRAQQVEAEPQDTAEDIDLGVKELADVIVINLMAKPGQEMAGEDLYRAMISCGFHHGDMNIFHRYEQHNGQGQLVFSVANVVEPGTFEKQPAEGFTTPGVCMFLKLPGPKRPLKAFDVMLDCARKISKIMGADLKDEHHSVMTQQTFEHYRQRVIDFERKQMSQKALTR